MILSTFIFGIFSNIRICISLVVGELKSNSFDGRGSEYYDEALAPSIAFMSKFHALILLRMHPRGCWTTSSDFERLDK
ncbi:hypothetical protein MPTK2_7g01500 [Marchantia polymorpha subsp. ruderalis]